MLASAAVNYWQFIDFLSSNCFNCSSVSFRFILLTFHKRHFPQLSQTNCWSRPAGLWWWLPEPRRGETCSEGVWRGLGDPFHVSFLMLSRGEADTQPTVDTTPRPNHRENRAETFGVPFPSLSFSFSVADLFCTSSGPQPLWSLWDISLHKIQNGLHLCVQKNPQKDLNYQLQDLVNMFYPFASDQDPWCYRLQRLDKIFVVYKNLFIQILQHVFFRHLLALFLQIAFEDLIVNFHTIYIKIYIYI